MKPYLLCWLIMFIPCSVLGQPVASGVYAWDKASVVRGTGFEERTLLNGSTRGFSTMTVQAITLGANHPTQPDQQLDEEAILIVKEGHLTVTLEQKRQVLGPGSVVLIMPGDFFRLENKTTQPLTYYQVRLTSSEVPDLDLYRLMGQSFWINGPEETNASAERSEGRLLFEGPTLMTKRMRLYVTTLDSGASTHSHAVHAEAELLIGLDKTAKLSLEGVVQSANQGDAVFIASNAEHTLQNRGSVAYTYLSIRFH